MQQNVIPQYWKDDITRPFQLDTVNRQGSSVGHISNMFQISELGNQVATKLSEKIITREILWMLQGIEATSVFAYFDNEFVVRQGITMGHTSQLTLSNILRSLAVTGTKLQALRNYVKNVCDTSKPHLKTHRAFGYAINCILKNIQKELSDIEIAILKQTKVYTCLTLGESIREMIKNVDLIFELFTECVTKLNHKSVSNSESMVHIINTQYNAVCRLDSLGHTAAAELAVILALFLETIRPCLSDLGSWITRGKLPTVNMGEFFIQKNPEAATHDSDTWKNMFSINSQEGQSEFIVPSFLLKDAKKILLAGKSCGLLEQAINNTGEISSVSFEEEFLEAFLANIGISSETSSIPKQMTSLMSLSELWIMQGKRSLLLTENFSCVFQNVYERVCSGCSDDQTPKSTHDIIKESKAAFTKQASCRPPLQLIFDNTLHSLIEKRYTTASTSLIKMLKDKFEFEQHMAVMKNFFLMEAGDIMSLFCSEVFMKIRNKGLWQNTSYLTNVLHESLLSRFPNLVSTLTVGVKPASEPQTGRSSLSIQSINGIFLDYQLQWPLTIIFDGHALERYNTIFSFLLQVKHALWALEQLRIRDIDVQESDGDKGLAGIRQKLYVLRVKLMHFVQGFHVYIMTRILHSSGLEFKQQLSETGDLEEVICAHQNFLNKVYDRCLLSQKVGFAKEAITRILNLCLSFQTQWDKGLRHVQDKDIGSIENEFVKCSHFIQSFLNNLIKRGSFPHLELLSLSLNS